jgi:uridine phosphorylase
VEEIQTGPFLPNVAAVPETARFDSQMPARLRPTAPIATNAILVGDPGRALMLAQELLEQPKMSNHARGLWGYSGRTAAGEELTIQSTGMGGPSASVVLRDLAELGVRRAIRIGTCTSLGELAPGELLLVSEARTPTGARTMPDPDLTAALGGSLGAAHRGVAVSLDSLHRPERDLPSLLADAADMQTAALLAAGEEQGVAVAALLIVAEKSGAGQLRDEDLAEAAKGAGAAATTVLST